MELDNMLDFFMNPDNFSGMTQGTTIQTEDVMKPLQVTDEHRTSVVSSETLDDIQSHIVAIVGLGFQRDVEDFYLDYFDLQNDDYLPQMIAESYVELELEDLSKREIETVLVENLTDFWRNNSEDYVWNIAACWATLGLPAKNLMLETLVRESVALA